MTSDSVRPLKNSASEVQMSARMMQTRLPLLGYFSRCLTCAYTLLATSWTVARGDVVVVPSAINLEHKIGSNRESWNLPCLADIAFFGRMLSQYKPDQPSGAKARIPYLQTILVCNVMRHAFWLWMAVLIIPTGCTGQNYTHVLCNYFLYLTSHFQE